MERQGPIANNPYTVWATKYRGITTKTIELLSSSYEGLKQNQVQLLSINGVRKEVWEITLLIQSYKVGNNDVVKLMKKRLELSHESAIGIIRNARNFIDSWSNMWDCGVYGFRRVRPKTCCDVDSIFQL